MLANDFELWLNKKVERLESLMSWNITVIKIM